MKNAVKGRGLGVLLALFAMALVGCGAVDPVQPAGVTEGPTPAAGSPVIDSFSATPPSITSGQSAVLGWDVSDATTISVNQGIGTVTGTSTGVSPTTTTTYTLTATNAAGSRTAQTTVTVGTGGTGNVYDASTLATESSMQASDWNLLKQGRYYFGHHSVGTNIINGWSTLGSSDSNYAVNITEIWQPVTYYTGPYFFHESVGDNYYPYSKISDFDTKVRTSSAVGGNVDVAFFKFCFVDIQASTDIDALADAYIAEMNALESAYPGTVFLWTTNPLENYGDEVNVLRNRYAQRIRDYASANNKPVYDLAALEAVASNGTRCTFSYGGSTYDQLCDEWRAGVGDPHLNSAASQRFAKVLALGLIDILK